MGRRKIAGFFELSAQKDNRGGRRLGTKQTLGERPACTQPVNESWVARCLGNFGNMRIADMRDSSRTDARSVHASMTAKCGDRNPERSSTIVTMNNRATEKDSAFFILGSRASKKKTV